MLKTRFATPYRPDGRTRYAARGRPGVYLIKENGKLVYVGASAKDIYKTMYRHFEHWSHRWQKVISYKGRRRNYTVRVIYCTARQAERLERALVMKHQPRDNEVKYKLFEVGTAEVNIIKKMDKTPVEDPF